MIKKIYFATLFIFIIVSKSVLLMAEDEKGSDETAIKLEETGRVEKAAKKDEKAAAEDDAVYPTQDRIIFSRTAIGNQPRDLHLTGYAAGIWDIDYAVNRNVTLGIAIQLPILSVGAVPHLTVNTNVTGNFAVGAGLFAGVWGQYLSNPEASILMAAGTHAAATWIKGPHMVNLGIMAADYASYSKKDDFILGPGLGVLASFGYRYSINKNWAFLFEVHTPFLIDVTKSPSRNLAEYNYGEIWAVMYGFRGHGDHIFGDFGFMLPLFPEYITHVWPYLPLGIPYFSIGMKF